ncbi:hypothetical protein [Actinoplanes sp. L3-i22]|uniref:hypothetical protein n=1 Tax=Actinoplanes sp. L3-i22 TaxID=2836373 RepID=UPI001C77AAE4|nr:hypothetical protein [Actinoplanes sp. L3-i22]BCY08487.1 hypothetical protein L3i22_035750 [Actinoplanes sp. L3-i22]
MPTDTEVLLARIERERYRLRRARQAMDGLLAQLPDLGRAVHPQIMTTIGQADGELDALAGRARRYGVNTARLEEAAARTEATTRVVDEAFALATGTLARSWGLDDGACTEADRLIAELAGRLDNGLARPTVPGDVEFLHRAAYVIRRRVPDHGVWDLPVMAHEFGHVLTMQFDLYDPVTNTARPLGAEALGTWPGYSAQQAEELFCDIFATYATGPAYPCTMILHRLDPVSDATGGPAGTHPPDAVRAAVVLETLHQLTVREPAEGRYRMAHEQLTSAWNALREHVSASAKLSTAQESTVRLQVTGTLGLLGRRAQPLRYEWRNAVLRQLDQALAAGGKPDTETGYQIRDVLTVAWLSRLDATGARPAPEHLETWARALI